jgi:hypothetical protein
MSAEQIHYNQSLLASISSQNPDVNAAAATVNQYTEMCKSGQLSKDEYLQLIRDVQSQINIQAAMAELDSMEKLNTAINGLIFIASVM